MREDAVYSNNSEDAATVQEYDAAPQQQVTYNVLSNEIFIATWANI